MAALLRSSGIVKNAEAIFNRICKGHLSDILYVAMEVPFVRFMLEFCNDDIVLSVIKFFKGIFAKLLMRCAMNFIDNFRFRCVDSNG